MRKKAFTLVELMVVVAVIAILASALLVGLGGARARARDSRRMSDIRQVQNLLELYYAKVGNYPIITSGDPASRWSALETELKNKGITNQLPKDPIDKGNYVYSYGSCGGTDNGQNYTLGAKLENEDHTALKDDIDDSDSPCSIGISCNDPEYCVFF